MIAKVRKALEEQDLSDIWFALPRSGLREDLNDSESLSVFQGD